MSNLESVVKNKQQNGVPEMLNLKQRKAAEDFYLKHGVDTSAEARILYFKDDAKLRDAFFNVTIEPKGEMTDNARLAIVEKSIFGGGFEI